MLCLKALLRVLVWVERGLDPLDLYSRVFKTLSEGQEPFLRNVNYLEYEFRHFSRTSYLEGI